MSTHGRHGDAPEFDPDDPSLSRFDLVREGARRDGVEIVHYAPKFPVRGTRVEKRVERSIALLFVISGLFGFAAAVEFIWWPQAYTRGDTASKLYTPLLGLGIGLSLLFFGLAVAALAKKLLPEEVSIQARHGGPSPADEQKLTGATILNMVDETGIRRRPLLKAAILLPAGGLGAAATVPLIGAFIKNPNDGHILLHTGWDPQRNAGKLVPLVREDGTPIRPEDVSVGGQMTVYPGIPGGATNQFADSPTLLIHLREADAESLRQNIALALKNNTSPPVVQGMWQNYVAYSKICTHAGCPASLYEQQTNRLLCPCHQSQFAITNMAKPIFGPAHRKLPMLPLALENGIFVAKSDYLEAIGPTYWERPTS
jgi:ubiquinol-cytochrome c reductase iron-sulfur subunit